MRKEGRAAGEAGRGEGILVGGLEGFDRWQSFPAAAYREGRNRPEEPYWWVLPDGKTIVALYRDNGKSGFLTRGMDAMAHDIGHSPTRIQLQRKSPRAWQEFMDHLREHSPHGMANTMARYQALRPSLYDFQDEYAALTTPVLLALGDEDAPCLETNLMLKRAIPGAGLWIHPGTGHAINLEEPAAFNAMVGSFFADVERRQHVT